MLTESDVERIAQRAADSAVDKMMLRLGADPESPVEIPNLKEDLEYLTRLHSASKIIKRQGYVAGVGILVTALAAILYVGVTEYLARIFPG